MALSIPCPGCEAVYPVPEHLIGKTIRCKKCNEMIEVVAPKTTRTAKPVIEDEDEDDERPAKPSRRRDADEEDERPSARKRRNEDDEDERPTSRRRRDADDEDDQPRRGKGQQKSKMPLILGGLAALLLIGGGIGAAMFLGGEGDKDKDDGGMAMVNPNPVPNLAGENKKAADEPKKTTPALTPTDVKKGTLTPVPKDNGEPKLPPNTGGMPPGTQNVPQPEPKTTPQPSPPPPPETGLIGRGGATSATGVSKQAIMQGDIPDLRRESALAASVFIKCETNFGGGSGSGWFGVEPGLVFTNAHVLDMKSPNSPEPKKLTIYLNSGTDKQREIPHAKLKILAVDRDIDLAVIQIIGEDNLPNPLKVKASADLILGQTVFTVGYPLGSRFGASSGRKKEPEVSWRRTSYFGLLKNDYEEVRRVKLESGANPGNSGGPVVDATGEVVCVVVEGTNGGVASGNWITLCVPTEFASGLIAGRVSTIEYGTPYKDKDKVKIPVIANVLNPLKKALDIRVRGWVADANAKIRQPGPKKPTAEPNDAGESEVTLAYDPITQTAKGEVTLPTAPTGRTYYAQPFYTNAYTTYAMAGVQIPMTGPPVDRVPSNLTAVRREGSKRIATLTNSSNHSEHYEGEEERKQDKVLIKSTLKVNETAVKADTTDQQQSSRLRIQFESFNLGIEAFGGAVQQEVFPKETQALLNEFIKKAEAYGLINRTGEMYKYTVGTPGLPNPFLTLIVKSFTEEALESLVVTSIPMPNKMVNAGETWTGTKEIRGVIISGPAKPGPMGQLQPPKAREYKYRDQVTYRYLGVRERAGKKEALVEIEGKSVQAPGSKDTVTGSIKGIAWVEIETGIVLKAKIEKDFEVDTSRDGQKKKLSGINTYEVDRGASQ